MIATPSAKVEESPGHPSHGSILHDPFLDYTQNIFAGLSFPEVPKNEITLITKKMNNENILGGKQENDMMIELQSTNKSPTVIKDPPRPSAQFIPQKNQIETGKMISAPTIASNSSVTEQTPIVRPNQFSLLYKNETGTNIPLYPSLTEMTSNSLYESPPQYLEEEDEATEEAPLISPTIVPTSQAVDHSVHDEVLTQLLTENTRLQQELESLRNSRGSKTDESEEIEALQRSMNYTLSPHPLYNQQTQSQQQIQRPNAVPAQTAAQVGTTQQNPVQSQQQTQQQMKYVCCGNCRQWLSAPRDATYVYCPGCEAVNNCALAPSAAPAAERAPPRVLEPQPWYLQCFSRVLG